MDDNLKNKIAKSIVNLVKLDLYYDGVGFVVYKIKYPYVSNDSDRTYNLKIELKKESWTFDMPAYGQLNDYLESLFRIKDRETKDEIREMIIDEMEVKVRKLRIYLLTP